MSAEVKLQWETVKKFFAKAEIGKEATLFGLTGIIEKKCQESPTALVVRNLPCASVLIFFKWYDPGLTISVILDIDSYPYHEEHKRLIFGESDILMDLDGLLSRASRTALLMSEDIQNDVKELNSLKGRIKFELDRRDLLLKLLDELSDTTFSDIPNLITKICDLADKDTRHDIRELSQTLKRSSIAQTLYFTNCLRECLLSLKT